ncbi:MAG: response regulator [Chitinophagales bacterium]
MVANRNSIFNKPYLPLPPSTTTWSPLPFGIVSPFNLYLHKEPSINLQQAKILLVGDITNQKITTALLESWNAEVHLVKSGLEAIEKVCLHKYDLALIDLQMPLMDGWEIAFFIRKRLRRKFPLIALSASIEQFDQEILNNAGFNSYIRKPIYPQTLYNLISVLKTKMPMKKHNITPPSHSIDVKHMKEMLGNDTGFIREIIHIFGLQTEEIIQKLPHLKTAQQTEALKDLVHKYKSSANSVGNKILFELCNQMENETRKHEPKWAEIESHCDSLIPECKKVLKEIPEILVSLKAA